MGTAIYLGFGQIIARTYIKGLKYVEIAQLRPNSLRTSKSDWLFV